MGEDIVLKISLINRTNRDGIVVQNASAIVSDVINSKRLSDLKAIPVDVSENYSENFVDVKNFLYVWSHRLVFNKSEFKRNNSQNIKYEYFVSQQTFGGKQLDSVLRLSPTKALSLVLQLTASLAVAEKALEFEHRDLHLSNLLIKQTDDKYLNYSIESHRFKLKLNGIKLVIIDTTFSRTQMNIGSKGDKKEIKYFYNNLSTLNLDDYQNPELKKVYLRQKEITANVWKGFYPKTNIIWLTYCVNRIYQKVEKWSQKHTFANDSPYSQHLFQLQQIRQKVSDSNSAKDFAHICQLF